MVIEYIRYQVPAERLAHFESSYAKAAEQLRLAPECLDYDLSRAADDPASFILRITWASAEEHLVAFRNGPVFPQFLAPIRRYIEDIQEMRHYLPTAVAGAGGGAPPSLYEWAGGTEPFLELCAAFYRLALADNLLAPMFATMDAGHARHVGLWLAEVFGGPAVYTNEHGGYPHMLSMHRGKAITEAQRRRWVNLMLDAADEAALPADPEFRAAFAGYLEWGTRLALANSQPDAEPVLDAPVPRWGWGVAPPYVATPVQ